jgi:signal transduction histidine kinase
MNRRKIINICIILLFAILFHKIAYSQEKISKLFPRTDLEFYILESELAEGSYLVGDSSFQGFSKYNNNEIPNKRPANDRMITIRSEFTIDSIYADQDIYLVVMPVNSPCNIYLNGEIIFVQGDIKYGYTSRLHYTENVLLTPALLRYNNKNNIAFQMYPKEGEKNPLNQPFITNANKAKKYVFFRNLLGPKLILASSFCGFIFFLYFLFTYISRREYNKQQYLYFAFMNLFLIFSLINNILTYDFTNTFSVELISRIGFQLSMVVGLFFLIEYTNVFKKKFQLKIAVLALYIPAILLLLFQNNLADLMKVNNLYPIYMLILGNFIFVVITLLYFLKEKNNKSFILLIVYLINLFAGFYDSYYFIFLKIKPYMLLTPNSVFLINLAIFFILLIDQSKIYHLAIKTSKQLRELNENLELLVEKRTKKTQEYANKLEDANKTKDKFFSIIAHDMKNPFNTLIGYSDILKTDFREYGHEEISQHLNIIYETSVKGYNLLENLLKWSQTQTNKIVFEPVKVDLHEIIQLCINEIEYQSQFKDIDINNDVSKNYHIIADKNLINTVIRNLINNAIKYTPRNGMVSVSSNKNNIETIISVKDTGIGMSETELQNLFKIDKIYSKLGTNKENGSGLGLILCKEFVEKHGGKIWVESELEIGSNFKFSIPKIVEMN